MFVQLLLRNSAIMSSSILSMGDFALMTSPCRLSCRHAPFHSQTIEITFTCTICVSDLDLVYWSWLCNLEKWLLITVPVFDAQANSFDMFVSPSFDFVQECHDGNKMVLFSPFV